MVMNMELIFEMAKFIIYLLVIVYVSKNILVKLLRKIAEIFDLSPKKVGDIAGVATSMPELLTVFFSSIQGLISTSIYNIISSNVINFVQYIWSIKINKNEKMLDSKAIKIELGMIVSTILIPIAMVITNIEANITIVPIFILLFILFSYLKRNVYKIYKLSTINDKERKEIEEEKKWVKNKSKIAVKTALELLGVGIVLFIVRKFASETLWIN